MRVMARRYLYFTRREYEKLYSGLCEKMSLNLPLFSDMLDMRQRRAKNKRKKGCDNKLSGGTQKGYGC
jgi:hypothetical protein